MDVDEAIKNKKLFIIDYHDLLLPFIKKINGIPGRKAYASRTVFFYDKGALKPIAIELSIPPTPSSSINKHVYTHGHDATNYWIWKLAKAHVCSNDAGVHQLVNHWLRTHACMEAYIIVTHRQLSLMHPSYKLLDPHVRYTLEINALARQNLINGGGIIEDCFSPGRYTMDLSSAAYKSMWRFDMEALPADLIRRGIAVDDSSMLGGVRLVIEDYPYAVDGLLVWSAIKDWVESYVAFFYLEPNSVSSDRELQAWWDEIKNKGHYDKRNEPWWPKLQTNEDLSGILTTMIWTASGQHATINFGQYPYGGYVPNRPTLMRKLIPLWRVITAAQKGCFEYHGTNCIFTVNQAVVEGQENSNAIERGMLLPDTYIVLEASNASGIKFVNDLDGLISPTPQGTLVPLVLLGRISFFCCLGSSVCTTSQMKESWLL